MSNPRYYFWLVDVGPTPSHWMINQNVVTTRYDHDYWFLLTVGWMANQVQMTDVQRTNAHDALKWQNHSRGLLDALITGRVTPEAKKWAAGVFAIFSKQFMVRSTGSKDKDMLAISKSKMLNNRKFHFTCYGTK